LDLVFLSLPCEAIFYLGKLMATQLGKTKSGQVTEQVQIIADSEGVDAEELRVEVAAGRVVIPANKIHLEGNLKPCGIGRMLSTKVNANIGTSSVRSSIDQETEKMEAALEAGADTIMDLSTGNELDKTREKLLAHCWVPFGTVPIYQVIEGRDVEDIDNNVILEVIEKQAKQGVDFFTIHAGVLKEHLPLIKNRVGGIVSRGGALLSKWMLYHNKQNPLYEMFDDLCGIMAEYDVCFSLGDGLRPGAIADATDKAQQIQHNMEIQEEICHGAPFYVLGPIVTDIAPGYDHITSAIGGTAAAFYGASFLCYVTPREHLGLPGAEDVRAGVIAAKIAAHAADIARGLKGVDERDKALSIARRNLDWERHLGESLDPKTAERMHIEACKEIGTKELQSADYCTMCGQKWCSVRINKEIHEALKVKEKE
jgi:phosphomethylpyrimidine synthase